MRDERPRIYTEISVGVPAGMSCSSLRRNEVLRDCGLFEGTLTVS